MALRRNNLHAVIVSLRQFYTRRIIGIYSMMWKVGGSSGQLYSLVEALVFLHLSAIPIKSLKCALSSMNMTTLSTLVIMQDLFNYFLE